MNFSHFGPLGGLSRRIYAAFLVAAVIPTALAGAIGVYLSLQALKNETLRNLGQEVTVRAQGIGRFFDQLSSELLYLAHSRGLVDVIAAAQTQDLWLLSAATTRLERDYAALASLYPHIYQIRLLGNDGREWVRVDRKADGVHVVPRDRLQNKGDRYYFREAMALERGQIYVSPLDLNVEFGEVEKPERPVIRVATPVAGPDATRAGILIINLHADILLEQIQQMADARGGASYLLDNRGHYLSRSAGGATNGFAMEPVASLGETFPARVVENLTRGASSPTLGGGWIVAHAPEGPEVQIPALYAFNTHSGKAILLKSPWKYAGWIQFYEAVKPRADKGELWVTNGRVNEVWQSGFDDKRKPYLSQRWPESFIFIHPQDAKPKGIESGDLVEVVNDTVYIQTGQPQGVLDADLTFDQSMKDGHIKTTVGKFQAVAVVSDEVRPGVAKTNFNFPSSPANAVVSAVPDPMTNNYRYKLGRGVLSKVGESPYKRDFTRMSFKPRNIV